MSEQELNRQFQAIRTFIEESSQPRIPKKLQGGAVAVTLTRLDNLRDKMIQQNRIIETYQRRCETKGA